MQTRSGEPAKTYFRTERFYTIGPDWFVATREGNDIGPFRTRLAAQQALVKYIVALKERRHSGVFARTLTNDCWANTNYR